MLRYEIIFRDENGKESCYFADLNPADCADKMSFNRLIHVLKGDIRNQSSTPLDPIQFAGENGGLCSLIARVCH